MPTLALVRHGRTEWNALARIQGRTDIPLDDEGRAQAARAAEVLAGFPAVGVVTSPLGRAAETGRIIAERLGIPVAPPVEDLTERGFGPFEGVEIEVANAAHPDRRFPGAETVEAVADRGVRAIREIAAAGEDAIVVAHGTLLRLTLAALTGAEVPRFANAEIALLEGADGREPLRLRRSGAAASSGALVGGR